MAQTDTESKPTADRRVSALDLRNKHGEVVDAAMTGRRIIVTRHDRDAVAVIGMNDYERFLELEEGASTRKRRQHARSR